MNRPICPIRQGLARRPPQIAGIVYTPVDQLFLLQQIGPPRSEARVGCRAVPVGQGGGSTFNVGRDPVDSSSLCIMRCRAVGKRKMTGPCPFFATYNAGSRVHMPCPLQLQPRYMSRIIWAGQHIRASGQDSLLMLICKVICGHLSLSPSSFLCHS